MSQRYHLQGPGRDNCSDCGELHNFNVRCRHGALWVLVADLPRLESDVEEAQSRLEARRDQVAEMRRLINELPAAGDEVAR